MPFLSHKTPIVSSTRTASEGIRRANLVEKMSPFKSLSELLMRSLSGNDRFIFYPVAPDENGAADQPRRWERGLPLGTTPDNSQLFVTEGGQLYTVAGPDDAHFGSLSLGATVEAAEMWAAMALDAEEMVPAPRSAESAAKRPAYSNPTFNENTGEFGPPALSFAPTEILAAWQPTGRSVPILI